MGHLQKCFHCETGHLSIGFEKEETNEIFLYCDGCGSNFRFEKEVPTTQSDVPEVQPSKGCKRCTCGKHRPAKPPKGN